jgi:hypothetical protein
MTQIPKPIAETKDTVTLSRKAFQSLLDALEDAQDQAAVRASVARGKQGLDDALPAALYRRIVAGEHPVRIWREYRGFGLNALAREAKISAPYLSEIEKGVKPGSVAAMRSLAKALKIGLDELVG